jgi:hypothetical protein
MNALLQAAVRVAPPLLLLPLSFSALDNTTILYWAVGFMAALVSAATLLMAGLRHLKGLPRGTTPQQALDLVRPALTLLAFLGAVGSLQFVNASSQRSLDELVLSLQTECQTRGRCPTLPEGWTSDGHTASFTLGHWRLQYRTHGGEASADDEFSLRVIKATEVEMCLDGGAKVALRQVNSVHCPI